MPQWVEDIHMPTRYIKRSTALDGGQVSRANSNAVFIDSDDDQLKFTTGTSGTTTVDVVTESQTQTLTNKTLTSPVVGGDLGVNDDVSIELGTDDDSVLRHRSTTLAANTALTDVLVGTPVTQALAANSLVVSNVTASGDILVAANRGGASEEYFFADASAGNLTLTGPGTSITFEAGTTVVGVLNSTSWEFEDNILVALGNDQDCVALNRSTTLAANTALTGALAGTPASAATPANSLLVSNITADGDIAFFTVNAAGANSIEGLRLDASAGLIVVNEAAADIDFRVEGDNNANMLVSDGGTDSLSLGAAVTAGAFATVAGSAVNRAGVTSVGRSLHQPTATYTQTNADPTTLAIGAATFFGTPTFAGSNLNQVITDAATIYVAGSAAAGTNTTLTRNYAVWVDAGEIRADGGITVANRGTVTQATDKATGVTLNNHSGAITMNAAALGAGAEATFTVTNSTVGANDVVIVNHASAGTAGAYDIGVSSVGAGSFGITVTNLSAGSLSEAIVINYVVIGGDV